MGLQTKAGDQRYLLGIWIAMGVLTPLIAWGGARGFAPAIGLMGLLCLPLARPTRQDWIGLGLLGALALWACVSSFWSPFDIMRGVRSLKELERFTGVHLALQLLLSGAFVVAAGRMREKTAEKAMKWFGYGLMALAVILVVEGATQAALYQWIQKALKQAGRPDLAVRNVAVGGYIMAALIWPVAVTLWRQNKKPLVFALAVVVAFTAMFLRGDSPTVALLVSAVFFYAVMKYGRPAVIATGVLAVLYFLLTPWVMLAVDQLGLVAAVRGHLPPSWAARLDIWTFTGDRTLEDPIRGWGLDASRMFIGYIQLHPHNGALQIWFELGLPGALLIAAFWAYVFWRISEDAESRLFAATACATAVVYLVIGAISFSLWQEWWVCLGAFAMAACVVLRRFVHTLDDDWTSVQSDEPLKAP
jgi:O-antigen ligase